MVQCCLPTNCQDCISVSNSKWHNVVYPLTVKTVSRSPTASGTMLFPTNCQDCLPVSNSKWYNVVYPLTVKTVSRSPTASGTMLFTHSLSRLSLGLQQQVVQCCLPTHCQDCLSVSYSKWYNVVYPLTVKTVSRSPTASGTMLFPTNCQDCLTVSNSKWYNVVYLLTVKTVSRSPTASGTMLFPTNCQDCISVSNSKW